MIYTSIKRVRNKEERKRIVERLLVLRKQLDEEIPEKTAASSLILATWNIREFGSDKRTLEDYFYIAEIISRFDLIALQEVLGNKKALEKLMPILGRNWSYIATDATEGTAGGSECMAFLYDTNKVTFKNVAGEIVLPKDKLLNGLQFARTPFSVMFQVGWFKFYLTTVHIIFGKSTKVNLERLAEIKCIAEFLTKRQKKEKTNYVLLGDFNVPKVDDDYMKALEKGGFYIPNAIKKHPTDLGGTKHYDQIAFNLKLTKTMTLFKEKIQKAGAFNFTKSVHKPDDWRIYMSDFDKKYVEGKSDKEIKKYYLKYRTFRMSDHLPLWVELNVDFSEQYLKELKESCEDN
ncbi:MAG: endonuclease/exonuclease/phosphatase family protein [Lentimicrobiaceae bacterium]|nr:endonuclease/exonuclease/phosphatase family protein [Lentimicrobiaceae bacterium]